MDTRLDRRDRIRNVGVLHDLSRDLGVSERTLRRAVAEGTVRGQRPSPHRLRMVEEEREWVRRHWPTVTRLRAVLRTEPSVRLAVLFGSGARGTEHGRSDFDLIVELDAPSAGRLAALEERLGEAARSRVQLVALADAEGAPGLLADALRDGRPLTDRDGLWVELKRREREIRRAGERGDAERLKQALRPLDAIR